MQVRDPWNLLKWNGDWCEGDVCWEEYPTAEAATLGKEGLKARKKAGKGGELASPEEASRFWMSWADFLDQVTYGE